MQSDSVASFVCQTACKRGKRDSTMQSDSVASFVYVTSENCKNALLIFQLVGCGDCCIFRYFVSFQMFDGNLF